MCNIERSVLRDNEAILDDIQERQGKTDGCVKEMEKPTSLVGDLTLFSQELMRKWAENQ